MRRFDDELLNLEGRGGTERLTRLVIMGPGALKRSLL